MKGLLYKDFVNSKGYLAVVTYYLFYSVMMVGAVAWEFNGAVGIEEKMGVLSEGYLMLMSSILVACLVPTAMATTICAMDNKTKWTNYAMALPGGYKAIVAEKYIVALLGDVVAVLLSLFTVGIIKYCFEVDVDGIPIEDVGTDVFVILMLLLVGVSLVGNAIILPLICKSKTNWINVFFTICVEIAAYAGFAYLALGDISFFQQDNLMENIISWITTHSKIVWGIGYGVVGAGVLAQIVSYVVTVKMYLKYA